MAADGNITKDIIYDAVAPDDFESMLELDRYNARSTAFDKIISATHDHFWDPLDKKYIDFDEPFDLENEAMVPEEQQPLLRLLVGRPGEVFARSQIMEELWQTEFDGDERACDVHISNLRQKVERDPQRPELVVTVRGFGYKFDGQAP